MEFDSPPADLFASTPTPLGPALVAWNDHGVVAVSVGADPEPFAAGVATRTGRPVRRAASPPPVIARALAQGDPDGVTVDLRGLTLFQRQVLGEVASIPRGEVRSYGWIARRIGRPRAVRAVGSAVARNPVPLVVPCHRVVRSGGALGQFGFGTEAKRALLRQEGVAAAS